MSLYESTPNSAVAMLITDGLLAALDCFVVRVILRDAWNLRGPEII